MNHKFLEEVKKIMQQVADDAIDAAICGDSIDIYRYFKKVDDIAQNPRFAEESSYVYVEDVVKVDDLLRNVAYGIYKELNPISEPAPDIEDEVDEVDEDDYDYDEDDYDERSFEEEFKAAFAEGDLDRLRNMAEIAYRLGFSDGAEAEAEGISYTEYKPSILWD